MAETREVIYGMGMRYAPLDNILFHLQRVTPGYRHSGVCRFQRIDHDSPGIGVGLSRQCIAVPPVKEQESKDHFLSYMLHIWLFNFQFQWEPFAAGRITLSQ